MRVALITMTRDRVDYSRHCFATLEQNAGCDFDWYVLDNASTDGTPDYLKTWACATTSVRSVHFSKENIGICAGANSLLDYLDPERYDCVIRYDNDCEVTQPGTLKACAELAANYGAIVAPRVNGLNNPPETLFTVSLGGEFVDETRILGGIFMAIPSFLFWEYGYRYDETNPLASGDEAIVPWWRARGGVCGYLHGFTVNHYETTEGQKARYPEYERRKTRELAAR